MIKAIFNGLFKIILLFANVFLTPVNNFITQNFPSLTILLNRINVFIDYNLGNYFAFFGSLIPPLTKTLVILWLTYVPIRFLIKLNISIITWVVDVIKRIKIW